MPSELDDPELPDPEAEQRAVTLRRRRDGVRRRRRWRRRALAVLGLSVPLIAAVTLLLAAPLREDGFRSGSAEPPAGPGASEGGRRERQSRPARLLRPVLRARRPAERDTRSSAIVWRRSTALGRHDAGRLVRGVKLPPEGRHYITWDPVRYRSPNRAARRYATDDLLRRVLRVLSAYRRAHPKAPRVTVGDLSRPRGGDFGRRFGPIAHVSHQNGLDADIYYPRRDRRQRAPFRVEQIDRDLAQDLVDRLVRAGALRVFVGPQTRLTGPPTVVQIVPKHDDHLHVRFANAGAAATRSVPLSG